MALTNQQFLESLAKLFKDSTAKHSVYVTSKRAPAKALADEDVDMPSSSSEVREAVLFRASNGVSDSGKVKFSTVVAASKMSWFQNEYVPLLRTQLLGALKKKDRAKEKQQDKQREQSHKKLVQVVDGKEKIIANRIGSKRGAGRRTRQRALQKAKALRKEKAKDAKLKSAQTKLAAPAATKS
ncbi:signal recognition particle, SRP9/SRP14 subunit [Testicularia cyperi]|uniref:Signal recognition particle subunit SRP14 n=1 Tax=Testicularia cyperi TaxID=1882483 RepID=A0A317XUJ8_9BASI|nr:signal recognition particle, SRP9/SRP14 subunit [Testicularia cyperi]